MSSAMETIGSIAQVLGQVLGPTSGGGSPFALPGGAMQLDVTPGFAITPQGSNSLFEPFVPTMQGHRAQRFIGINPTSGRQTWFGPMGQPVLWTGDFRACKRVRKVAGKARRRAGGR